MAVSLKSDIVLLGSSVALRQGSADPSAGGGLAGNIGDLYFRTTTMKLYQKVNTPDTAWVYLTPQDLYGTGVDGDVTIAVNTNNTRDQYYNNLTVQNTFTFDPRGYRIFVRDTLTVDAGGIIDASGVGGGVVATAGAGAPPSASTLCTAGASGGAGVASPSTGGAGGASGQAIQSFAGAGGAGGSGNGGASAGGAAGAVTVQGANAQGNPRSLVQGALQMVGGNTAIRMSTGAGGGGGGGDGTAGGGGGGGGGLIQIYARRVINNGTIRANGGNGGSPSGGNRGGGGGGGGGVIVIGTHAFSGNTPTVTKGTGGVKQGNGVNGGDGGDGLYILLQL